MRLLALLLLTAACAFAQTLATFAADDFETGRSTQITTATEQSRVTPIDQPQDSSQLQCSTTGPQSIAVLEVTTPSNPALPAAWNPSAVQQAYFASTGLSLNTYWQDASYGKTSATGQVFGPYALSVDYDCSNLTGLATAAIAAATNVDFTKYTRIGIIFPVQTCVLPGFGSIGGYGSIGCFSQPPIPQNISIAWLPIPASWGTPANSVGILAHEHGHNLGLHHGNTEDYGPVALGPPDSTGTNTEYGDPFSVMGQADIRSTRPTFGQYTAQHKSLILNWLTQPDYQEVTGSGSFTIAPYESASGTRALRILRDATAGSWLWLEYRQPTGTVDSLLSNLSSSNVFNGALIHYENPNLDPIHTWLLDMNPASAPNNFLTAALIPGRTWSDPDSPLSITVNSAGASGLSVTITRATSCSSATITTSAVVITAPASCSWTVSTASSWIALGQTASGTGNASIPYTLQPNTTANQRLGYITVSRQSLPVIQSGTVVSVTAVSPAVQSAPSGQLSIALTDPIGASDIVAVYVTFSGAPSCAVDIYPPSRTYALTNDAGTGLLGPTATATLSNSVCSVLVGSSSVALSGTNATLNLAMSFTTAFAGSHHITITAQTNAGQISTLTYGTWTVPVSGAPTISPGGIVPIGSTTSVIAPGSWFSIYGSALTNQVANWAGDYPTGLGGVSVTINGKPAYLAYVSPTQINALAPDDSTTGSVPVILTGPNGIATSTVTLAAIAPALIPAGATKYAAAVIPAADGSYTYASTTNPVKPGQVIELFAVGLGPTSPAATAGQPLTAPLPLANTVSIAIGGLPATVNYAGMILDGLYQLNVVVPAAATGDAQIVATIGSAQTPAGVYLPVGR